MHWPSIFSLKFLILDPWEGFFKTYYCMHDVYVCTCHIMHVEVWGQYCGVSSLLLPLNELRIPTQATGRKWQALLPELYGILIFILIDVDSLSMLLGGMYKNIFMIHSICRLLFIYSYICLFVFSHWTQDLTHGGQVACHLFVWVSGLH